MDCLQGHKSTENDNSFDRLLGVLKNDVVYQRALNEQRLAAGESPIDNFDADDLRDKVTFAQLLEAIQHVSVEPAAVASEVEAEEPAA